MHRYISRLSLTSLAAFVLILVNIISFKIAIGRARRLDDVVTGEWANDADIGPEYPLLLPNILVTMEDTEQYGIFGDQANAEWVATTPRSLAYVRVGNGHRFMAISFGHQMHCIRELRVAVAYPSHPAASFEHTSHCLNYLRMYILCNPDLTMERFDPLERNFTSERFGATHVCKDWRLIYEMFERKSDEWADFRLKNMTQ